MSTEHPHLHTAAGGIQSALSETAALENYVRLQRSQSDYLAWLEANEKKPDMDRYVYRKIR